MRKTHKELLEVLTQYPIATPSLELRQVAKRDALELARFFNSDRGDFQQHIPDLPEGDKIEFVPALSKMALEQIEKKDREEQAVHLFVADKRHGRHFLGVVRVWQDGEDRPRISPYLLPSLRGNGLLTELFEKVVGRVFAAGLLEGNILYAEAGVDDRAAMGFLMARHFRQAGEPKPGEQRTFGDTRSLIIPYERRLELPNNAL